MKKILVYILFAGCLFFTPARANTTFTLDPPDGAISGLPGTTVGWGFTFTNDTDYALITGTQFCDSTSSPLPAICVPPTPDLGTYTDFSAAGFLVIGPAPESPSVSEAFDNSLLTGIGSFAIDPGASGTESGIIVLTYDLYSVSPNDPNFDPTQDEVSGGNYLTAAASVSAVPEPGYVPLLGIGLAALGARLRRSRRSQTGPRPV